MGARNSQMADFVGADGCPRSTERSRTCCGCDPRSGWPGLGPGLNDPQLGPV